MAWEEVPEEKEEKIGKYWNPEEVGDKVEEKVNSTQLRRYKLLKDPERGVDWE